MNKAPFSAIRLGTRFSYEGTDDVWCKIGHNEVAEWDDTLITAPRQFQSICRFGDDLDEEVVIRELHTSPAPD